MLFNVKNEDKELFNEVINYEREYLTDKQKLNCKEFLQKVIDAEESYNNISFLREEMDTLYDMYYFNQNDYLKLCSIIFMQIENKFLSEIGSKIDSLSLEELNDLNKEYRCNSKYNEMLYPYRKELKDALRRLEKGVVSNEY